MNVRLVVLGLLDRRPMHGYELRRVIEESRLDAWAGVLPGSIYHALRQLAKEGLVAHQETERTGARSRDVYRITSAGRAAIKPLVRAEWEAPARTFPTSLYGALAFRGVLPEPEERSAISARITALETEIDLWEHGRRSKGPLDATQEAVFDNGLAHLRADLHLLKRLVAGRRGRRS